MSTPQNDPGGNTEAFRAFVHSAASVEQEAGSRNRLPLIISVVLGVVIVAAIVWFVAR